MAFVTKSVVPSSNHAATLWRKVLPCGSQFLTYPAVWTQWVGTSSRAPTKSTACISLLQLSLDLDQTWGNWGCKSRVHGCQLILWHEMKKRSSICFKSSTPRGPQKRILSPKYISNIINAKLKSYTIMLQIEILRHQLNWTIDHELSLKT